MLNFMQSLRKRWRDFNSLVCVGLDIEPKRFPTELRELNVENAILRFNQLIIDATQDLVCAYKLQMAHYAAIGAEKTLEQTIHYIHEKYSGVPVILDAKRGDIGSTAEYYALEAFERYQADAVTVNPYLGTDSLQPFLKYHDKGIIILCHTSNPGAKDIQELKIEEEPLYLRVAQLAASQWNAAGNVSLVIGATKPESLKQVRNLIGDMPLLVPGIGAQGGDIESTVKMGQTKTGEGLIINSSRAILYQDPGLNLINYGQKVRQVTEELKNQINQFRNAPQ